MSNPEKQTRLVILIAHQQQIISKIEEVFRLKEKLEIARAELKKLVRENVDRVEKSLEELKSEMKKSSEE